MRPFPGLRCACASPLGARDGAIPAAAAAELLPAVEAEARAVGRRMRVVEYSYFRDRDGTLCRRHPQGSHEVWWPDSKQWAKYFWDSRDVVEITPEDVRAGWGAKALA